MEFLFLLTCLRVFFNFTLLFSFAKNIEPLQCVIVKGLGIRLHHVWSYSYMIYCLCILAFTLSLYFNHKHHPIDEIMVLFWSIFVISSEGASEVSSCRVLWAFFVAEGVGETFCAAFHPITLFNPHTLSLTLTVSTLSQISAISLLLISDPLSLLLQSRHHCTTSYMVVLTIFLSLIAWQGSLLIFPLTINL